jgi:hypothetical protein
MGNARTSIASGYCMRVSSCPPVRSYLTAGGALAGAGILALGLVAAPPDSHGARTEVRAVQLAAFALPSAADWRALEEFISNQAQTVVPITQVAVGGAADIPGAGVNNPSAGTTTALTFESAPDPAINTQEVEALALEDTATAVPILEPILAIVSPILGLLTNPGALLLFAPIILLVILACPPCALFNFVTGVIQSFLIDLTPVPAVAAAAPATLEANTTIDSTLPSDGPLRDSAPGAEIGKAGVSPSMERTTGNGKVTSKKDVTETVEAEEESTEPTAVTASESLASDSTSETAKPAGRPETPRPVVRDSLRAGKQLSEQSHPGNGDSTADDEPTTAGSSSVASSSHGSSSKGSRSSDGDSSDSDSGGSE